MKRIAILGCENSHANAFLKCISTMERYSDVEVVGVYSNDPAASQKLCDEFGVPVLQNYTDAVGKVDGLVITARHGGNHYPYAAPYIANGIPMFIDKPITVSEDEAVTFMRELKARGVRFCGGSSLKQADEIKALKAEALSGELGSTVGGYVRAPYQPNSEYGGFYFYAQHLVEMVCEIFGRFPLSVTARKNGDSLHVLFHYDEYDCVGLFCDHSHAYFASRMSEKGTTSLAVVSSKDWYAREFDEFYTLLSGGEQTIDAREFISPVFIMNAIERSIKSGREEAITYRD